MASLDPPHPASPRRIIGAIVIGSVGNLIEWYDFYIYSFGAIYFAPVFFPKGSQTAQLLGTAGVFAVGFLMRPIGGWLFGRLADTRGRRAALTLSVLLMCGGSLLVAVTPSYAAIGVLAPLLLLLARLAQGFSVGGEYGTSATYLSELAQPGRRGFYSSFQYVTLIGGQLLALLAMVVVQKALSPAAMAQWGWRLPFAAGAIAALFGLKLRRTLPETSTAASRGKARGKALAALWPHRRAVLIVFGLTAGGSLFFYTFTTYMQKRLVNTGGLTVDSASLVMAGALLVYLLIQPLFGALSDRISARTSVRWFGLLATLLTVPLLRALGAGIAAGNAVWLVTAALVIASFYSACGAVLKADLFPIEVRALGVGFSYAIANALFGGTAEYVALQLKAWGVESYFGWYVMALVAVSFLTASLMPETAKSGFLDRDTPAT